MNQDYLIEKMCEFIEGRGKDADEVYVSPKQEACFVLQEFCVFLGIEIDLDSIVYAEEDKVDAQTPKVHQALKHLFTKAEGGSR